MIVRSGHLERVRAAVTRHPDVGLIGKRQVKSPKVCIRDSGILHSLLGIADLGDLLGHPKLGASWEGFAMQQVTSALELRRPECYFWATHNGAELALLGRDFGLAGFALGE